MDLVKIGKFLAELRKEKNLTQEQLGTKLGISNKTISRWETGTYLPPVEMLKLLSEFYGISINEILSGEKLNTEQYICKAEENIVKTLSNSIFTTKEKIQYFKKKWQKDHLFETIITMIALLALIICGIIYYDTLTISAVILSCIFSVTTNNRMQAYIEDHVYNDKNNKT